MNFSDDLARAVRTIPDFPKPGIQFKDITPLLSDPVLLRRTVDALARPFAGQAIDKVVGIESRGFIFGAMLSEVLGAGFIPVRKQGKLPAKTFVQTYDLEYGSATIEMHRDALKAGERVLIHDDVLATGGTAAATASLIEQAGGTLVGYVFLIELGALQGRDQLRGHSVHTLLRV